MSFKKCCVVPNCNSFNLPTYGFPRIADERSKWATAVGLRPESIGTYARICIKHFKAADFIKGAKRLTLRPNVVPFIVTDDDDNKDWFEMETTKEKVKKKKKLVTPKKNKSLKKKNMKKGQEKVKITKSTQFMVAASTRTAPLIEKVVETPDVQNTTVIDKDYYFVMLNKHSKDMINENKVNTSETMMPSKDLYSFNDILKEAIKVSSSVDSADRNEIFDRLKMPNCFNPDCRQLAGRVYLLQNQKDKLQIVYDELQREVESMEWNYSQIESSSNYGETPTKQICSSCVDGRLKNMYIINAKRVNYLQKKLNEIKQENIILMKELKNDNKNEIKKIEADIIAEMKQQSVDEIKEVKAQEEKDG